MTNVEGQKIRTVTGEKRLRESKTETEKLVCQDTLNLKSLESSYPLEKVSFNAVSLLLVFDYSSLGCEDVHAKCDVKSNLLLEILL